MLLLMPVESQQKDHSILSKQEPPAAYQAHISSFSSEKD